MWLETTRRPFGRRVSWVLMRRLRAFGRRGSQRSARRPPGRWAGSVIRSGSCISEARRGGSAGRSPVIACRASGNLAGWAVASTMRGAAPRACLLGRDDSAGGMRVEQVAAALLHAADAVGDFGLAGAGGRRSRAASARALGPARSGRTGRARPSSPAPRPASRPAGLEQVALEVGGDLDVHGRRGGGLDAAHLVERRWHARAPGCRCRWWRWSAARSAAPCGAPRSRPGCRRSCRSAR